MFVCFCIIHVHYDSSIDFLAIVFDDAGTTDHKISSELTVSPLDDNEIDFRISFDKSDDEDYTFIYDKNSFSCKLIPVNNLKTDSKNDNIKVSGSSEFMYDVLTLKPLILCIEYSMDTRAQRHMWLRYEVKGYTNEVVQDFEWRLGGIFDRRGHVVFTIHTWRRLFKIKEPLVRELMLEFFSTCRFADTVLDLEAVDVLKGGSEGAQMSRGDFIVRFVDHFGMRTKERLQGTTVVVGELIEIDLDELSRLHICEMLVESLGSARTIEAAGLCHKGWRGLRRSMN
nr:hypothetical protein [Tanacetum cinerariifolium]